jgi:phosphohistidine phosphatase SixA
MAALAILLAIPAGTAARAGVAEWEALDDKRGVVVLMRHAIAPGGGDPPEFRLGDCRTQRNLSGEGRAQARLVGRQIRASGVEIADVLSSPWCRSNDTARLLGVGDVTTRGYLGSTFTAPRSVAAVREARTKRLIESHRGEEGIVIIVGHYANIMDLTGLATGSGEGIAVRMNRDGELDVIGRLPAP